MYGVYMYGGEFCKTRILSLNSILREQNEKKIRVKVFASIHRKSKDSGKLDLKDADRR